VEDSRVPNASTMLQWSLSIPTGAFLRQAHAGDRPVTVGESLPSTAPSPEIFSGPSAKISNRVRRYWRPYPAQAHSCGAVSNGSSARSDVSRAPSRKRAGVCWPEPVHSLSERFPVRDLGMGNLAQVHR
jgi:hypothetical protein